jgi:HEPN domain-containing protein/predicted nucleotidyltransferase
VHVLATLEAIVERLVTGYDPDRIILFGSHAAGDARGDSDVDLLIVKQTDKRPIDRRIEVERLLGDRSIPLDMIVYTPEELRRLFAAGSPFVEAVIEHGRVLYMRKATAAWLQEAQDELDTALLLLEHEKYRGACLHSQQCVEKLLKALLLEKGKRPPRTHDLVDLLNSVVGQGWTVGLDLDDAVFLNSVYRGRYPTEEGLLPHGEPSGEDARRAASAAGAVMARARTLLEGSAPS